MISTARAKFKNKQKTIKMITIERMISDNEQSCRWQSGAICLGNLQFPMPHVLDLTY